MPSPCVWTTHWCTHWLSIIKTKCYGMEHSTHTSRNPFSSSGKPLNELSGRTGLPAALSPLGLTSALGQFLRGAQSSAVRDLGAVRASDLVWTLIAKSQKDTLAL